MRQGSPRTKAGVLHAGSVTGVILCACLVAVPAGAQMKRLDEGSGIRVIRQLDKGQTFQGSTTTPQVSLPAAPTGVRTSAGAKVVSAAESVPFDTKRLQQSGGTKVYRDLDKKIPFETSTYKPKVYKTPQVAPSPSARVQQPIFRTQPKTFRTHRAGVFDDKNIVVHGPGRADESKIITHGPGRSDESKIVTHGPGRSGESKIVTHGPGRSNESKIITHRAGSFGYK